jgi:acetyl esterase/lipase
LKKGKFVEYFDICHRISVIRFMYYISVGAFNIRDSKDNIQISDDVVKNVPIRIYRPLNSTYDQNKLPVIFYYHGGGYFLGSAGNKLVFFVN